MYPHFCLIVEIKVDASNPASTYHRVVEESRDGDLSYP